MTIPEERVDRLESLASEAASAGNDDLAREYVKLARRVAERHRLSLPRSLRWFTCDACDRYLLPGRNATVRTRSAHVVVTCECGAQNRHPYDP